MDLVVDGPASASAGGAETVALSELGAKCILAAVSGWLMGRCVLRLDVFPSLAFTFLLHTLQMASSVLTCSPFSFAQNLKYCQTADYTSAIFFNDGIETDTVAFERHRWYTLLPYHHPTLLWIMGSGLVKFLTTLIVTLLLLILLCSCLVSIIKMIVKVCNSSTPDMCKSRHCCS